MSIHSQRGEPDIELDVPSADQDDAVVGSAGRRCLVLAAMCAALVAVVTSVSGRNVAQQALAEGLGATQSLSLWITHGYSVVLVALLMLVGAVGDRWGRKPILGTTL